MSSQEALDVALHVNEKDYDHFEPESSFIADQKSWESAMNYLGSLPLPPPNEFTAQAEVIRIAHNRIQHPELYAELTDEYVLHWRSGTRAGPSARYPEQRHLNERYRLAWEYLTIRPTLRSEAPGYGFQAHMALGRIHGDETIPLLVFEFNLYTDYVHRAGICFSIQTMNIGLLGGFKSVRGLEALVACAQAGVKYQAGIHIRQGSSWDPIETVQKILQQDGWPEVIAKYKSDPANKRKIPSLDSVLSGNGIHA